MVERARGLRFYNDGDWGAENGEVGVESAGVEEEGDEFVFFEIVQVGAFFSDGHGGGGGYFAGDVGFFLAGDVAVVAEPFFFFELDDGWGDGAVVAELVPGRVAAVAEDDLVCVGGVPSAAVYADGGFAGFSAFFGRSGGGGVVGGGGGCVVIWCFAGRGSGFDEDGGVGLGWVYAAAGAGYCEGSELFGGGGVVWFVFVVSSPFSFLLNDMPKKAGGAICCLAASRTAATIDSFTASRATSFVLRYRGNWSARDAEFWSHNPTSS